MKKKIIIIGKNSFIGFNLIKLLKKNFDIKSYGYRNFLNVNRKFLLDVNYVINCTSNKQYVNKKYSKKK